MTKQGSICAAMIAATLCTGTVFAKDRRPIPVPSTVSPALQAILAQGDTAAYPPLPASNAGWRQWLIDDAAQHKRTAGLLARFGVTMARQRIAGVDCFRLTPRDVAAADRRRLLVHVHGGGYVLGAGEGGTWEGIMLAAASGLPVIAIDYRMPPDHPFPAAIDDAMAVWTALLRDHDARDMAIFGTSTGGALTLAMVQRARRERLALPAAIIAGSPWADLSKTGDSYFVNEIAAAPLYDGVLAATARAYAGGIDLKDPRLSPVYGDFASFPPTLLISGTRDIFLSNTVRVQRKLRDAGVATELAVYEGQNHAAYLDPDIPEAQQAFADMARFLKARLRR